VALLGKKTKMDTREKLRRKGAKPKRLPCRQSQGVGVGNRNANVRPTDSVPILASRDDGKHTECLGLTKAVQETAECLGALSSIYDEDVRTLSPMSVHKPEVLIYYLAGSVEAADATRGATFFRVPSHSEPREIPSPHLIPLSNAEIRSLGSRRSLKRTRTHWLGSNRPPLRPIGTASMTAYKRQGRRKRIPARHASRPS
jgi:hypothetical protein